MRQIMFAFLCFGSILYSCHKDPEVPPVPPVPPVVVNPPTISVSADTTLNFGDSTVRKYTVKNSTSCKVAGKDAPEIGTITLNTLLRDTTITITASNSGGTTTKSITVKAKDWSSSVFGILTHFTWRIVKREELDINKNYIRDIPYPFSTVYTFVFTTTWKTISYADGILGDTSTYALKSGAIITPSYFGPQSAVITTVNSNTLVLVGYDSTNNDYIRATYSSH